MNSEVSKGDLIEFIRSLINENIDMTCKFDELDVKRDSLCISSAVDNTTVEKMADMTGNWMAGTMSLDLIYRIVSKSNSGGDDIESINFTDSVFDVVRKKLTKLNIDGAYFTSVKLVSGAKLTTTYPGGIKDFTCSFLVSYERKVVVDG